MKRLSYSRKFNEISVERKSLSMHKKEIMIRPFFNQIVNTSPKDTFVHCSEISNRRLNKNPETQQSYRKIQDVEASISTHHGYDFRKPIKNPFSRVLKYNMLNNSIKSQKIYARNSTLSTAKQNPKQSMMRLRKSVVFENKSSSKVRRQLQDKFYKTRMIFRQQQKLRKLDKIQKIYQSKYNLSKKWYRKTQNINNKTAYNTIIQTQRQNCSPWIKQSTETYEYNV